MNAQSLFASLASAVLLVVMASASAQQGLKVDPSPSQVTGDCSKPTGVVRIKKQPQTPEKLEIVCQSAPAHVTHEVVTVPLQNKGDSDCKPDCTKPTDWLLFVQKLIEVLAWPIVTVVLVLLLRREIKTLLSLIRKLKAGPIEAEFEREVQELRSDAGAQLPPEPALQEALDEKQKLLQLAQINPRSAILEAWRGIEFAAERALIHLQPTLPDRSLKSQVAIARALGKSGVLNSEEIGLYHELRTLRNQASHLEDFNPNYESALNYIELSVVLKASLLRRGVNG